MRKNILSSYVTGRQLKVPLGALFDMAFIVPLEALISLGLPPAEYPLGYPACDIVNADNCTKDGELSLITCEINTRSF